MSQELRVVPAALLESVLKTLAGVAPGRFSVEAELRAIVDAPVQPAVQDRESKVNELVELMDRLSGGMRHFAGAIIDAGWTKLVHAAGGEVEVQRFWAEEARNIRCVRESDFDSHVTRLQAEKVALSYELAGAQFEVRELTEERDALKAELAELAELKAYVTIPLRERTAQRIAMQSELTKARELLEGVKGIVSKKEATMFGSAPEVMKELRVYLAHQSAPAAKGEGDER